MSSHFHKIEKAIHYLVERSDRQPGLAELASHARLSPTHFQKLFKRWAGVSPKQFLEVLTAKKAKECLVRSQSVLSTTHSTGLSSSSRLHDLFITLEGITPGEYKAAASGVTIDYGIHQTVYGRVVIGQTGRGICFLSFSASDSLKKIEKELHGAWPKAKLRKNQSSTLKSLKSAGLISGGRRNKPVNFFVKGTPFQLKVWQALLSIPDGGLVSYQNLAERIGHPGAARAVGTAVGQNQIALLIPCHRVIRESGVLHSYRWGESTKKVILGRELSKALR